MAEFDPDAFLAASTGSVFDPDAFLASKPTVPAPRPFFGLGDPSLRGNLGRQKQRDYREALRAGAPELPAGQGTEGPDLSGARRAPEQLGTEWYDVGKGVVKGVPATLSGGMAGDIEAMARYPFKEFGLPQETAIPTTVEGGYLGPRGLGLMEKAATPQEAAGMSIASMVAPLGIAKGVRALRGAEVAQPPPDPLRSLYREVSGTNPPAVVAPVDVMTGRAPAAPPPLPTAPVGSPLRVVREESGAMLLPANIPHVGPIPEMAARRSVGAAGESPLTGVGQPTIDKLVQMMRESDLTPWTLESRLEEMSPHQFLGETTPSFESVMSSNAMKPGRGKDEIVNVVHQRAGESAERMRTVFNQYFDEPQNLAQLRRLREIDQRKASDPLYREFKSIPIPMTPELAELMPRLRSAGVFGQARRLAAVEGKPWLAKWMEGTDLEHVAPTAESWDLAKQAIDAKIEASFKDHKPTKWTRVYTKLKHDLIDAIDNHPDDSIGRVWRQGRETFGAFAKLNDAEKLGRKFFTLDHDELPFLTAGYTPGEWAAFRSAVRKELENQLGKPGRTELPTMRKILGENNQQKLRWVIGDEATDALVRSIEHEYAMHFAPTKIVSGSQTAGRLGAADFWEPPTSAIEQVSIGDVMHMRPVPMALKAAEKVGVGRYTASRQAAAAKIREEAARVLTLQGPERDAVLRWLLEQADETPRATGGAVRANGKPFPAWHPKAKAARKRGGRIRKADAGGISLEHTEEGLPFYQVQPNVPFVDEAAAAEAARSAAAAQLRRQVMERQPSDRWDPGVFSTLGDIATGIAGGVKSFVDYGQQNFAEQFPATEMARTGQPMTMSAEYDPRNRAALGAAEQAFNVMGAGSVVPTQGVGVAGGKLKAAALPMDEASRMARAAEQGYTTDAFHGTSAPEFSSFDPSKVRDNIQYGGNFYFTPSPEFANKHVGKWSGDTDRVMPVKLKIQNPFRLDQPITNEQAAQILDALGQPERAKLFREGEPLKHWTGSTLFYFGMGQDISAAEKAQAIRKAGYDAIIGDPQREIVGTLGRPHIMVYEPEQIRSRFAAFDPANEGKSFLLGANAADKRAAAAPFYSAVEQAVTGARQERAPAAQWIGTIRNSPGVKPEEVEWLGLEKWLAEQKGPVTKKDVSDYIRANQIEVREIEKGARGTWDETKSARLDELEEMARRGRTTDAEEAERQALINEELSVMRPDESGTPQNLPKFSQWQLPGGENYRELLLTLPFRDKAGEAYSARFKELSDKYGGITGLELVARWTPEEFSELSKLAKAADSQVASTFKSGHFDEPNVLAHIRFNDRTIDGKRTLFIEEVQSDWHQTGRKRGYQSELPKLQKQLDDLKAEHEKVYTDKLAFQLKGDDAGAEAAKARQLNLIDDMNALHDKIREVQNAVPDAPFKTTWPELAMKRMIRYAAEHGYDKIAWTPGDVQAARYDLSRQIDALHYEKHHDGTYFLATSGRGGGVDMAMRPLASRIPADKLEDYVGKDIAEKIVNGEGSASVGGGKKLTGLDLKVGGEGMLGFYDQILPAAVNKLTKKYGAKVGEGEIVKPETKLSYEELQRRRSGVKPDPSQFLQPVHTLDITDKLRDVALSQGFSMFAKGGRVRPAWHIARSGQDKKISHEDAAYTARAKGAANCAGCSMFYDKEHGGPACSLVKSPISPRGWCKYFEAKGGRA